MALASSSSLVTTEQSVIAKNHFINNIPASLTNLISNDKVNDRQKSKPQSLAIHTAKRISLKLGNNDSALINTPKATSRRVSTSSKRSEKGDFQIK